MYLASKDKTLTTLDVVAERVESLSKYCTDEFVKVDDISFNHLESMNIGSEAHYLRPAAQQEIAFRLGIPIQYLRKCPSDLQAFNMNHWIKKERNEELFFRFDGSDVRAIFTPKYKPVDNFEILERLDSFGYGPETEVQCHLDGEFMLLNIPDGDKTFTVSKGDAMVPGISVSNSEVGLASLSIAAYILRLICTNGLVSTTAVSASYRHVSRRVLEEFPGVMEKVSSEVSLKKRELAHSLESNVPDPLSTIESFNRQFQLRKEEREAVDWAWPLEIGPAMFHIVQTYTRAAQFEDLSAESRYRLQRVGGLILGMVNKN
jgi:Domain of unknown function (DUF932)